ncbi:MAG: hypothetical protein JJ975_14450 [Bacteroidia bacterium]|nr:hypothetical protein [Bacteroidia bacterium]
MALTGMIYLQSCKDDDGTEPEPTTNNEFIADDATFANWASWDLVDTKNGVDPALGGAHAGNDSTAVRKIYVKDGQKAVNGAYPVGTLVVKHMKADSAEMITAMAKRGNGFDAANNDWEYFVIQADGKIVVDGGTTMRGSTGLMNGMCVGCHAKATTDYIFTE